MGRKSQSATSGKAADTNNAAGAAENSCEIVAIGAGSGKRIGRPPITHESTNMVIQAATTELNGQDYRVIEVTNATVSSKLLDIPPAAARFEINQRPRRQIKHKYIKSSSYAPFVETPAPIDVIKDVSPSTTTIQVLTIDGSVAKPVRKRGRPRKIVVAPIEPSPIIIDDSSSSSNPAHLELLEIITDDPDAQMAEEVVETCNMSDETEQYELMMVEDISQSETDVVCIDSEATEPDTYDQNQIVVHQESDDTYVVTVGNGDDSQTADMIQNVYVEVTDSLDSDAKVAEPQRVDDSVSQNSTLNSLSGGETELVYGFDGDQPVCKTTNPTYNGAFSGIRKSKQLDATRANGISFHCNNTGKPSAVEIAVQQLNMLGVNCPKVNKKQYNRQRRDAELSLSFQADINTPELNESEEKANNKSYKETFAKLVRRATRRNSMVNLPSKSAALKMIKMVTDNLTEVDIDPLITKVRSSSAEKKAKVKSLKDQMQTNLNDLMNKTVSSLMPTTSDADLIAVLSSGSPKKDTTPKTLSLNGHANEAHTSNENISNENSTLNHKSSTESSPLTSNTVKPSRIEDSTIPDDILNNITHKKYRRNISALPLSIQSDADSSSNDLKSVAIEEQPKFIVATPIPSKSSESSTLDSSIQSKKHTDSDCAKSRKSEKSHKKNDPKTPEQTAKKHRSHDSKYKTNLENSNSLGSARKSSKSSTKSVHLSNKSIKPADNTSIPPNSVAPKSETKPKSTVNEHKSYRAAENHKTESRPDMAPTKKKTSFDEAIALTNDHVDKRVETKRNVIDDQKKRLSDVAQTKKKSRYDTSANSSTKLAATTKRPEKKVDSYSILSDCYLPKMVKHDASLYSIEAMRAADAQREAEAKEVAAARKAVEQRKNDEAQADAEAKKKARQLDEAKNIVEAMRTITQNTPKARTASPMLPEVTSSVNSADVIKNVDITYSMPDTQQLVKIEADQQFINIEADHQLVKIEADQTSPHAPRESSASTFECNPLKAEPIEPKPESPATKDDAAEEETNIRRSGRIKIISETKQRSQGYGLVRDRERFHSSMDVSLNSSQEFPDSDTNSSCLGYGSETEFDLLSRVDAGRVKTIEEIEKEKQDVKEGLSLFEQIIDNEFKSERNISKESKRMTCDCFLTQAEIDRGEFGCGEDCLNRLLMIECGSRCVVGQRCTNKRFQKHQNSDCTIFKTEKKGFGLTTNSYISAGDFIMEYVGEVLNSEQFEDRANEYSKDQNKHYYFMALRSDCVIDATARGNISRFINHSCDPNAETQKWTVNGELRIGFFSTQNIAPGQEITFDYQFQRYGKEAQRCYCESKNCRGWIGEEPESEDELEDEDESNDMPIDEGIEDDLTHKAESICDSTPTLLMTTDALSENVDVVPTPTSLNTVLVIPAVDAKSKRSKEAKKQRTPKIAKKHIMKRSEIMEDPDLDQDIEILTKSNLKNQTQTLRFSRLMVRAKLRKAKSQLLSILRCGELACRRLFLDYHGLKLIYTWMCDTVSTDMRVEWEFRLEILETLDVLPILNKLMLQDSKVLATVRNWAILADGSGAKTSPPDSLSPSDTVTTSGTKAMISDCDIPKLIEQNSIIQDIELDALKQIIDTNQSNAKKIIDAAAEESPVAAPLVECEYPELMQEIHSLAVKLSAQWDVLPEVFRIPKKLRIEQMKEHEREANRNYRALGLAEETPPPPNPKLSDRFRERDKDPEKERLARERDSRFRYPRTEFQHPSEVNLCKFQRRKMFEAKVAAEKDKAMRRMVHSAKCNFFRLDGRRVSEHDIPFCVNPSTGQWYSQAGKKLPTPPSHLHIKPPQKKQTLSADDYNLPPLDLPEFWKHAIDPLGRLYYYHIKIRIPQWRPPIKLLPLSKEQSIGGSAVVQPAVAETHSESEESSETESEDSSEDELQNKLAQIKKIKGKQRSLEAMLEQTTSLDDEISAIASSDGDAATSMMNLAMQIESIVPQKKRKCRKALVQERIISPRTDEELHELRMEMRRYKEKKHRRQSEESKRKRLGTTPLENDSPLRKVSKLTQGLPVMVDNDHDSGEIEMDERLSIASEGTSGVAAAVAAAVADEESAQESPTINMLGMHSRCVDELDTLQKPFRDKIKPPTAVDRSQKRPKKAVPPLIADDVAKRIKEKFQRDIAVVIVHFLSYYRRDACTIGRITSDDDFRHLAKKLSHFVMLKELKHCDNTVNELIVTESVKSKAKDFIRSYMTKFGSVYTKSSADAKPKNLPVPPPEPPS